MTEPGFREILAERFVYTSPEDPSARPLIEELTYEYESRYGDRVRVGEDAEMNRYPAELFLPPHGAFVLLLREEAPIGGGAFMRYDGATAELKRIWTRHDLRRQGIAQRVVKELEGEALLRGYQRIYLTTGTRQPEAVALYLKLGYRALYDPKVDPETLENLPFEKSIV